MVKSPPTHRAVAPVSCALNTCRFLLPLHILKRSHGVGGEGPAFDAFGVDFAGLGFGVAVDRLIWCCEQSL